MLSNYTLQYDRNGAELTPKDILQRKSGEDI